MVRYGYAILFVVIALGAALALRSFNLEGFLFVIAVAMSVWFGGRGPAVLAIVLSIVVLDYFFVSDADRRTTTPVLHKTLVPGSAGSG